MYCIAVGVFSLLAIILTAAGDATQTKAAAGKEFIFKFSSAAAICILTIFAENFRTDSESRNVQVNESLIVTASSSSNNPSPDVLLPQPLIPILSRFSRYNIHRQMASWAMQIQVCKKSILDITDYGSDNPFLNIYFAITRSRIL